MKLKPSELDMARDVRRFWWVIPPFLMAGLLYVFLGTSAAPKQAAPVDPPSALVHRHRPNSIPSISVRVVVGDIRVEATKENLVTVTVMANGSGFGAEEAFRELNSRVEFAQSGDKLDVTVTYVGEGSRAGLGADIVIRTPTASNIELETNEGAITITDVSGDVRAVARKGNITATLPSNRAFSLAGDGRLQTDFPLTVTGGSSFHLRESGQSLLLRAPTGIVRLRKH